MGFPFVLLATVAFSTSKGRSFSVIPYVRNPGDLQS
jgi:hypothetical protein